MTAVVATAPGKIVVCGEYAVLHGAPAICMAVNRRARVRVEAAELQTIRARGLVEGEWSGCEALPDSLALVRQIWDSVGVNAQFGVELDTDEFADPVSRNKLGLGSSAALTAALVTALLTASGSPGNANQAAQKAHGLFQRGRGSGIDVVTSLTGGVIEYRMQEASRPLAWPLGLEYAVLWSGRPASTSEKLAILDQQPAADSLAELCKTSVAAAESWPSASPAELLAALRHYTEVLEQFDVDHGLGIFDAGHHELARAAAERELVYKPCGAGGGDIGMVFGNDGTAVAAFAERAARTAFRRLDVSLEAKGVILES